jgi:hypothetical protein
LADKSGFFFQQFEKFTTYEGNQYNGVWSFEICTRFLKRAQNKYFWNVAKTEKCHLLPAVHFIFVQDEASFSTVLERTEADILCAVKY